MIDWNDKNNISLKRKEIFKKEKKKWVWTFTDFERSLLLETVYKNPYIPDHIEPFNNQAKLLSCNLPEVIYGGAAGGGKSWALLMAALQYVDYEQYNALILRNKLTQMEKPNALIPLAKKWLLRPEIYDNKKLRVHWSEKKHIFTFPSGATVSFGYLENRGDENNYQGPSWQTICFDELTQFRKEDDYDFLFSRCRKEAKDPLPLRVFSTSNPGGRGHTWVKDRFINNPEVLFIKSLLYDNKHLNQDDYLRGMQRIKDPVLRAQMMHGDWDIAPEGNKFKEDWFNLFSMEDFRNTETRIVRAIRFWDLAITEEKPGKDPDWTVGVLLWKDIAGKIWIADMKYFKKTDEETSEEIKKTAISDGTMTTIGFETEAGALSGFGLRYLFDNLRGFNIITKETRGKIKASRITNASAVTQSQKVNIIGLDSEGNKLPWVNEFFAQMLPYPSEGVHDDVVFAYAGGIDNLGVSVVGNMNGKKGLGVRSF